METAYQQLPLNIVQQIEKDKQSGDFGCFAFPDSQAVRRKPLWDKNTLLRPAFVRDCEKILHLPVYNRYNNKTQVFSFYENDDLSRRGLHVQLVSRIARNIGRLLGLNQDLIEAIALGHDLGHTPFGHAGERILDELMEEHLGKRFMHNVHSVRVLDTLYSRNVSLQVLDGILCHNGELEQQEYRPSGLVSFETLKKAMEDCYTRGPVAAKQLIPATLEGCVVRISDMIAYLGKDRQDALTAKLLPNMKAFSAKEIGTANSSIINNLVVDLVTNSYGKNYLSLSPGIYEDLRVAKQENYQYIYNNETVDALYNQTVKPMFWELYDLLLSHLQQRKTASPIYAHHLQHIKQHTGYYQTEFTYGEEKPEQIVMDYLASMTDSYFLQLHEYLLPNSKYHLEMYSYFHTL
ncbi:MAG: HD domain-containing protein [Clostridia bacterium]|nr:HD domain-containing protein [Clostridia bacterium]